MWQAHRPPSVVAYQRLLVQRDRERMKIVPTALKENAAPMGAAFVARERLQKIAAAVKSA